MQDPKFAGWAQTWHDDVHIEHRSLAIRKFGKAIIDPVQWKQFWNDAQGTAGLLHLLSSASVLEVKAFCHAVDKCNRRGKKSSEREKAAEELVMALLPHHYPSTKLRTTDKRPLQKYYGRMLRACSSSFVECVLDARDQSNPLFQQLDLKKLLFAHDEMLKKRLSKYIFHDGPELSRSEIEICLREFVFREPPHPTVDPNMSSSMQFAFELLQARTTLACTAKRWPSEISEMSVFMSLYNRFTKKSRSADRSFLIRLAFQLIKLKAHMKSSNDASVLWAATMSLWKRDADQYEELLLQGIGLGLRGSDSALPMVVDRWKKDYEKYEHILVSILRQGLGGSAENLCKIYENALSQVSPEERSPELRWRLLRLYCQHVPKHGIDINTSTDFECLAKKEWSFEVVDGLDREKGSLFMNRLYKVNPSFNFLGARSGTSIYSMRNMPRHNFNVELLLASYHKHLADSQEKAQNEVDQLRKKAAGSREQHDRATFAKAAAHYAIATGDLPLYAETVLWQHRFIRDTLTARALFEDDALLTLEGIDLLSGIPLPVAEETTLSAIRERLVVANQIMRSLNDAKQTAEKEPSYECAPWAPLSRVYFEVYRERVSRIKKVKLQQHESEIDIFKTVWEGITELTESIGAEVLREVSGHVRTLVDGFSGPALIAVCEALLDYTATWKTRKDSNKDTIGLEMEVLTYAIVSKLTSCTTPTRAQDLIQRVIIEHPEASSWHRQILSVKYMKSLPAEAAKSMLLSFAAAIGEKLEEQSYVKVGDETPSKSAPPRSVIKVTTVKYLAQLLNEADFVSSDSAVEVLIELFQSGTHPDVRIATLDSLLGTLSVTLSNGGEKWRENPILEQILRALDTVIPIAGNVNERRPVGELEWAQAEKEATVPLAFDDWDLPPLFEAILNVPFQFKGKLEAELSSRIVLPTLKRSQEEHRRWVSLFLAKHKPGSSGLALPSVPITPKIWVYMLKHEARCVPPAVIKDYNEYMLFRMRAPRDVEILNGTLRQNEALRNDSAVQHWLSIFDRPADEFWRSKAWENEIILLLNLLIAPVRRAVSSATIMTAIVSQASVLLDDYDNHMQPWCHLVTSLGPTRMDLSRHKDNIYTEDMKMGWDQWRKETPLLAQRLIAVIEQNTAMKADLPSTFPLRLWCLPYPDPRVEIKDEAFRHFAATVEGTLTSFLESDEGNVLFWSTLADEASTTLASIYTTGVDSLYIALHFGDLDLSSRKSGLAVVQLIKVTVALRFIGNAANNHAIRRPKTKENVAVSKSKVGELMGRLRAVMEQWTSLGKNAPFRDMLLQWKDAHRKIWEEIHSCDLPDDN
ncbi:hypothetical protein F5Y18DRAFT_383917 [Xylariaceae sp. FL1019]|nr:hypothetical protein F5Y18DRAFT_383917 [Xylariaceae sp. FL1019]